jgi:outer membrane protein W
MKKTNLTVLILILVLVTIMLSMATSAFAHEEAAAEESQTAEPPKERDWILRFGIVVADTNGSTSVAVDPGSVDVRLNGGGGAFANLEYAALPWLGLEFGSTTIGSDLNVSAGAGLKHVGTDVDILGMSALTLGANFRFVRTPTINVYAGPMVSFNRYSKWSYHTGVDGGCWPAKHDCDDWVRVESRSDSEVTWGGKLGIDIVLTKRGNWALSGAISYIDATYDFDELDGGGRGSINYDPLMFSFGGGFRW